jgi:hypothetical protein
MRAFTDEVIVHGCVLIALSVAGFMRSFNVAVVGGIIATLLIHYRRDFLPERREPAKTDVNLAQVKMDIEMLQEKVSQLNALIAFKAGLAGRKPGEQVQK